MIFILFCTLMHNLLYSRGMRWLLLFFCAVPELCFKGQTYCWVICSLGVCQSIASEAIPIVISFGDLVWLAEFTQCPFSFFIIYCSFLYYLLFCVFCMFCSSLETPHCPCSVYNLQVGQTYSIVPFPHLQAPWCIVTQGPIRCIFQQWQYITNFTVV